MLSPFGKALRHIRLEKGLKLLDIANAMSVSSAFISALETGRRAIPDGFVAKLGQNLTQLGAADIRALRIAADRTRKEVKVDNLAPDDREFVAAFARSISELPEELKAQLKRTLLKSVDDEQPFRRRRGMIVPAQSAARIHDLADKIRDAFIEASQTYFPIVEFLELALCRMLPDFVLQVRERHEMGPLEGMVVAGQSSLALRVDVYEDACRGVGRARFTAAHELGHFLMHRHVALARTASDGTKIFCDSEWQADTFAGGLLMSRRHVPRFHDTVHAARACGLSESAAGVQLEKHRRSDARR